jgi:integrase
MICEKKEDPAVRNVSPVVSPQVKAWQMIREAGRLLQAAADLALGESSTSLHIRTPTAPMLMDTSVCVNDLVNQFMLAKARAQRSDRYLRQLHVVMKSFAAGRAWLPISEVRPDDIEQWLNTAEWSARTQRGYLADVRTLYNFAVRRGLVSFNPAAGVELPVIENFAPPAIHTPAEVRQVLEAARARDPDVCRHLAIRYFAGVRSSEAHRMTEQDLLLDRGVIEVPAVKAKTRRRRLVTIQENLRAWLELEGELRPISPMTVRAVIRASKVEWHHNVTRHSFVSYHLAQFQNAAKTALEAGHTEQMLFSNYRELVTPDQAKVFWSIVPL